MTKLYGAIEAGGTKFVCMVASGPGDIQAEIRFPTSKPDETLAKAIQFFKEQSLSLDNPIHAIGIACFGPIDLNHNSPTYGYITSTPKPYWANTPVVSMLQDSLQIPVAFDTDVNVAAVGEGTWGAAQGLTDFSYLTIGTGIGGGVISGGIPVHGLVHEEVGHIQIPHDKVRDPFVGGCPYHKDCFEGLASGPAIEKRWGQPAYTLPDDHPAWELEANYIASALHTLVCITSPQRIILGGGVMQQAQLFPIIRHKMIRMLNGYVRSPAILDQIDDYIIPPGLGNRSGGLGAIAIARQIA
jgi:fructokinase